MRFYQSSGDGYSYYTPNPMSYYVFKRNGDTLFACYANDQEHANNQFAEHKNCLTSLVDGLTCEVHAAQ